MTLLTNPALQANGAAVHALVVGVGSYPFLNGGTGEPSFTRHEGMGQLQSPPVSAAEFADWLMNTMKPYNRSLGSVDILCTGGITLPNFNKQQTLIEDATLHNLFHAADRWMTAGDKNKDNLLLFYFCGHGVSSGQVHSLLMSDFGSMRRDPFPTGAVDANAFMDGVRSCVATNQLFLFDACRTVPEGYLSDLGVNRGAAVISGAPHGNLGKVHQAAFWATALGSKAYGRKNKSSLFMEAFKEAMHGAGSELTDDGSWKITTNRMKEAIDVLIKRVEGSPKQYVVSDRLGQPFHIHQLEGLPKVPTQVNCTPITTTKMVSLECSYGMQQRPAGKTGPWHIDVPYGEHHITASHGTSGDVVVQHKMFAAPPSTIVPLPVGTL